MSAKFPRGGANPFSAIRLHGYAISASFGQARETLVFIKYNVYRKTPLHAKTDVSSRIGGLV